MSTNFYTTKDGLLFTVGSGPDSEACVAPEGFEIHDGLPAGFNPCTAPYAGARWHVENQMWVDTRSAEDRANQEAMNVLELRKAAYPSAADLGDALYWQSKGDNSKMEAYLAACERVKAQYPKIA